MNFYFSAGVNILQNSPIIIGEKLSFFSRSGEEFVLIEQHCRNYPWEMLWIAHNSGEKLLCKNFHRGRVYYDFVKYSPLQILSLCGQMSPWQMLPGQMSLWQLESVQDSPRNLSLKFGRNQVSNSWDIADIEFVWGGVGWYLKSFSSQTQLWLNCCWVDVELGFWQYL